MIAPMHEQDDAPIGVGDFLARCAAFFDPDGRLARAAQMGGFSFEYRPQQRQMAAAVARALSAGGHLAVEAGTGVGKSFAYLVPMIEFAVKQKRKAIISTYTISLQEQLIHKDIPLLKQSLEVPFAVEIVKGRGNYLCLRRLSRAEHMRRDLFARDYERELHRLRLWADRTEDGSLQELDWQPPEELWSAVCVEEGNCAGARCAEFARCPFIRARRRAQAADVLIVNHHLLFADLALRAQEAAALPEYAALVVDEAHQMEEVASEHLGIRLSQYAFEHWQRRLYQPDTQKGLLAVIRDGEGARAVAELTAPLAHLFAMAGDLVGLSEAQPMRAVRGPLPIKTDVPDRLRHLCAHLAEAENHPDPEVVAEIHQVRRRGLELAATLTAFLDQELDDHVYWMALEGRRPQTVFYSAPVEVGPTLKTALFDAVSTVVLTSATLAVNGSLAYFRQRVGAEPCAELAVGSPFNYARQMRVWIPRNMPDPAQDETAYAAACAEAVRYYVRRTGGHAFVLFTSAALMRQVAARVRADFEADGLRVLVQNEGLARRAMLEHFRAGSAVLFGLDSFWMGVDVRGDALRNVIITRLPFAVPDHPLIQARFDRIRARGGDPFREYSLPEAVIKFRQGVGRLIRSATDTGVIVVLDPRILTRWYGRWFLKAIPDDVPVEIEDWPERPREESDVGDTGADSS